MNVRYASHVDAARHGGVPIVGLETSIWCQGLPYPQNLDGARRAIRAIEEEGACGALLAVSDGNIRVGLESDELAAWCRDQDAIKTGVRDLGWMLAGRCRGATTVSACLAICDHVGLPVFVTGGIGGVHRGGEGRDVSSDLLALASHSVCVVSSGAKSVLDIEATLEMLESLGVPVVGYGTDVFPVFYSPTSRWTVTTRVDDPREAAVTFLAAREMGLKQSTLVANPVPARDGLDFQQVDEWVSDAVVDAELRGVAGKAVTPFLLAHLHQASEGATLRANLSLIECNARLGARIACALQSAV